MKDQYKKALINKERLTLAHRILNNKGLTWLAHPRELVEIRQIVEAKTDGKQLKIKQKGN